MRCLRTFLWHSIMIHRPERLCVIEKKKKERYWKLARTFACLCEEELHNIFQPGFQCLMCQASPVSLERCSHIPVPVRVQIGGHVHPFTCQKSKLLHGQFSNPEHSLFWFIGDFCYPVSPLPPSWIVNLWPERESLGDLRKGFLKRILKKNHKFHCTVLSVLNFRIVCYCSAGTLG